MSESTSSSSPLTKGGYFTAGWLVLLILVFMVVAYPGFVFGTHTFFYRDAGLLYYPNAYFFRESFWSGEWPLWNPYSNCGIPFAAQWITLVYYPLSLIYLLLPLPWSMNLFLLLHMFIAGIGMHRLARRWTNDGFGATVAGLVFACNGLFTHSLMWASVTASLAWMPWVWLTVEDAMRKGDRRTIARASLVGGMQMLASTPEVILLTWMAVGAYWIFELCRKELSFSHFAGRLSAIIALVTLLSLVQLLPFYELVRHSQRTGHFSSDFWSMPPWGVANFLVPLFRCTPSVIGVYTQDEQQLTSSYYLGIGVMALALWAVFKIRESRVRFLACVCMVGILFALGEKGKVYDIVRVVFPILGFIRYPIKFIVLVAFCVPLLAAMGIAHWRSDTNAKSNLWPGLAKTIFGVGAVVGGIVLVAFLFPFPEDVWEATWKNAAGRLSFLALFLIGLRYFFSAVTLRRRQIASCAILLLIVGDLLTHTPTQNPLFPPAAYNPMDFDMKTVPRLGEGRAMLSPPVKEAMERSATRDVWSFCLGQRSVLLCNCNLLDKIPKVDGFFPTYLKYEQEVEALLYTGKASERLVDFLGVSQMAVKEPGVLFKWNARTNYLPLVTGGQMPSFTELPQALEGLTSPAFDPREMVYLPIESKSQSKATNRTMVEINDQRFSARTISFTADAVTSSWVVVAQSYYPGWKATIDGTPVKIYRANYAYQALEVPSGKHRVELRYENNHFYALIVSSITALACVGLVMMKHET